MSYRSPSQGRDDRILNDVLQRLLRFLRLVCRKAGMNCSEAPWSFMAHAGLTSRHGSRLRTMHIQYTATWSLWVTACRGFRSVAAA